MTFIAQCRDSCAAGEWSGFMCVLFEDSFISLGGSFRLILYLFTEI